MISDENQPKWADFFIKHMGNLGFPSTLIRWSGRNFKWGLRKKPVRMLPTTFLWWFKREKGDFNGLNPDSKPKKWIYVLFTSV